MKKNKKIAAIDIGSHNCRLLVVEKNAGKKKVIFNHSKPTNLIKNLSFNNEFNSENISKTLNCLIFFKKKLMNSTFCIIDVLQLKPAGL